MQGIIKNFINGAVSAYMTEVVTKNISGSLAHQNLDIAELEIFPNALLQHGVPLEIKKGTIRNIRIQVPTRFLSDPIKVTIDSVTIVGSLCNNVPTPQDFVKMKIHMLEAYELFRKRYKNLLGLLPTENFVNTSLKIFSNIIFEINNIFVQIEIRNNDELIPSKKFEELNTTIGIVIPKLLLQNPKNWKPNIADITKEVIFTDLGIYIDINQPSMNVRDENRFNDLFKSKDHNWIMKPFTFSAIMRHVDGDTKIEFAPTIDTVYVHILEKHIPVFINLMNTMGKFLNKFSVAHIPKPNVYLFNTNGDKSSDDDHESAEKMWLYLHRCAVSKISNAKHDFSSKLDLVRKRLIYIKYFKKKDEKYKRMIREIEESLDYTNIIAFRSALRILKKRKRKTPHKKKKRKITPKITKEIKKLMVQDPVYIVTKFISVLSLNFIGHRVTLALEKNDGCPHFIIDMKNAHFLLGKQTSSLVMDAIISYISIKHVEKKTSTVFKSLDNPQLEMKAQVIIPFLSYSTWSMSLNMSSNNYFLNLRGILRMMTDLGLINLMKEIDQSPVKTNRIFDLSVNVRGSSLTVQTHKNHSLKFGFDRFSFTTDASSRSNVIRSMKLENSWIISNAAKTEVKISTDFSLTGSITQNKIFLNIPIFSVALPFTHIVIIEDIIGLITTYHKMFKNISVPSLSFEVNMTINNSKFDIGFGMNAIDSSFLQIESKEMIKLNVDVQKSRVDVEVKLQKFILHVLPLMNLIAILPKLPSSSAKVNLNLIFHPVICSLVFNEDCFNIQFDKPIKFKLNTLKDSLQMMLKVSKLNVNLNQEKLVLIQSIDLEIGKSIKLDIPQIDVMISMLKLYKIYKMIKSMSIPSMGSSHDGEQDQKLYQLPYQSINLKLPVINIVIHQIKTMRCIFLSILENKFSMKKKSNKIDFSFVSKVIIGESDGFQANDLASPFYFRMNGRFSKNENYVNMKIAEPVQLIIKQKVFIEILKTLTSSETDIANPYSISNETGRDIKIIANGTEYKIKNQRKSQSIPSLYQANLSLKIGKKTVPINVLKLSSKLSIPLFFDEHFILVWADTKKLCLRFLSPLSFKNKANISIDLNINGIEINLKNGQKYCLDYAADQCNEITAKYNDVSQVIKLNETQVVDFNGYFVVVNRKRKESSLHSRVTFSTPFSIYQTLNCPLHISLCNQKHILKPCFYEPIPLLKPCAESIEFRIHRNEIFKGVNIYIQNNTNKLSVQAKCSKDGEPFSLRISILNNIIYISAAVVIYNSLSLPLDFSTTLEKTILPFKDEVDLFPIDSIVNNQYNKLNYDSPIMFSPNEKDGEPIYFGSAIVSPLKRTAQNNDEYQWCKQSIPIPNFEDQHDLILPIGNDNVSLIHTHVINHSENRPYSAIFFVSPKYRFVNNTEEHINLNLYDNDVIKLPARSSIPVTVIRKSLEFSFSVGKSIMSRKLNIDKIYSQFIKFRTFENPIHIELSHEKGVNLITFSTNHQLPYIFVNKTNSSKVTFIQKDSADFARTVHSDNSIPFFIYDENLPHIIFCKIGNDITAEIDIDKPSFPTKITDNLNYSVDKSGADGSIVYINESPICVKNEEIFDLSATVNYLSILLVSDGYHEFSRITIKKLLFDLKSTQLRQKLAFRIKSIQVDDQNIYACYPVIFQILPMTKKHAITLECTRHSNNKYDSIVIDIQPISLNIDLSFLSDIIGWIGIFNGKSYIIEKTHDVVQLSEIRANLSPRMTQYNIHNIKILPISINLTYNTLTTRNEHRYSHSFQFTRIYSLIPSMNNVNIGIGVHQFRNLSGTTDEIASQIFSKIKSDFIEQLSLKNIIIGSGKMITSVAKNLIVPENHGQQGRFSGITNKTKTILAIGETAFQQCSIIINAYTDSIPHARTDVTSVDAVKWGFSSLAYSFSKGLVSFMIEPFARGKNKGCCGYIEGTGVGIVKFAANSMAGVCDLGAGLMCGAKRLFYEDEIRKNREMEPLFRLKNHDDEELIWVATSIKSGLVEIYTKTIYIESINKQMKVTSKIDIKDNCVTFYQENDNKISCYFDEEVQAKVFYNIIHAQSLRQKVIKRIAKNSE